MLCRTSKQGKIAWQRSRRLRNQRPPDETKDRKEAQTPEVCAHSPAKIAKRMKRRWRIVLMRSKGELLGYVAAVDVQGAEAAAV